MSKKSKELIRYTLGVIWKVLLGMAVVVLILTTLVSAGVIKLPSYTPKQETFTNPHVDTTPEPPRKLDAETLYMLINNERTNASLSPLTISPRLEASACAKANDMVSKEYWSHYAPDGTGPYYFITHAGYSYRNAGENLLYGFVSEDGAVDAWMNSAGHRANILGNYTEMGICVILAQDYLGKANQNVVVNHFATPY